MKNSIPTNRRKFIKTTAAGTAALSLGLTGLGAFITSFENSADNRSSPGAPFNMGFDQKPLPYKYDALEDIIDTKTMEIHYSKHAATYSKNLKEAAAVEGVTETKPLEDVLKEISKYSAKLRNNAGGHFNHEMFWQSMRPKTKDNKPTGILSDAINKKFASFESFKTAFADTAKNRFGSGWAWLYKDASGNLKTGSTPNQDNPFMDVSDIKGFPILGLDVWEHAYYLKYQNRRADYIDAWWNVVNWDYVQQRFEI